MVLVGLDDLPGAGAKGDAVEFLGVLDDLFILSILVGKGEFFRRRRVRGSSGRTPDRATRAWSTSSGRRPRSTGAQRYLISAAIDCEGDFLARAFAVEIVLERVGSGDGGVVDLLDDVAGLETGEGGGRAVADEVDPAGDGGLVT